MSQFIYPNFPLARPNIWHIERGGGIFKSEPENESGAYVTDKETWLDHASTTTFSKNTTVYISTAEDLAKYAKDIYTGNDPNSDVMLRADIDLSGYEWYPIGTKSHPFKRSFYGYHTIKGMYINQPNMDYVGLIGYAQSATISNITLDGGYVCGRSWVGSVVGFSDPGSSLGMVTSCKSNLTVEGSAYVGGIGGDLNYGGNLVFTGVLKGTGVTGMHGGIVGDAGLLYDCTHDGPIYSSASDGIGGIAGRIRGNLSTCRQNGLIYNDSNSTATYPHIGGLTGIVAANNIRCADSMATGQIFFRYSRPNSYAACLVGDLQSGYSGLTIDVCCANIRTLAARNIYGYIGRNYWGTSNVTVTRCYVINNDSKHYSDGYFSNYSIVENINDGLPVPNSLFSVAVGGFSDTQIKAKFGELGMTLAEWC